MPNCPQSTSRAGFLKVLLLAFLTVLASSCSRQPEGAAAQPAPQAAATPIPWGTIQPPAQVGQPAGTPQARPTRLPVRTFKGTGIIRAVNLQEGWFEIDHDDIEGLMPAMKMEWSVRDKSLLKSVGVGDRVEFTLEDDNGSEVVTGLKKSP